MDQSHDGCADMNNRPNGASCPTYLNANGEGSSFKYCNKMSKMRECLKKNGRHF